MDLDITEYQPGDLSLMNVRPGDFMVEDPEDYIYGMANVLWNGSTPVCIGGVTIVAPGVGHAWSYISDDARPFSVQLIKFIKWYINEAMENLDLHRVHITVQAHLDRYKRFAEILGFTDEGVMKAAAPNKADLRVMAIVRLS